MAVSYKGLVIKFGGDTAELQTALKQVQKQAKNAQSNLRDVNKELQFDPGNTELLELKMNALSKAIEQTETQLDAYKQALSQLESKKQSSAGLTEQEEAQYDSLRLAIKRCERQLEEYGDELDATSREADGSQTALYKMGQAIEDNADKISSVGSKVSAAGTAISGGVIGATTALVGLADSQEEAIVQNARLEQSFVSAGGTTEQAAEVYSSFYRILGDSDTATEASQNLARLTTDEQQLKQWTDIAAGAYATFGDALPLENLAEAAQETAHTSTVTGGLADALNWSTASAEQWSAALSGHSAAQQAFNDAIADGQTKEDAFNAALAACGSEQERAQLITDTLTGLYGEAGKQYQETNADLLESRDAQNEMSDAMREMGEAVLPVKTAVMELGAEVMDRLAPALQAASDWFKSLSPEQQELVTNLALGAVAFGGVTTAIGKTMEAASGVGSAFKTAGELFGGAKKVMGDTGFLTKIGTGFSNIVSKAGGLGSMLTGTLSSGWTGFTGLIAAHPIGLGVAAVTAAVGGLTWFFTQTETGKQLWSDFTGWISEKWQGVQDFLAGAGEFFGGVWDTVTQGASDFASGIGETWENLKQGASDTWENLKQGASDAWENLKSTAASKAEELGSAVGTAWENLKQGASDTWENLKSGASTAWENLKSTVSDKANAAKEAAGNAWEGLKSGASNAWENLKTNTANAFQNIAQNVQTDMNTAKTVGSSAAGALQAAMNGDWNTAKSQATSAFNAIKSNIQGKMDAAKSQAISIADRIGEKLGFPGLGSKVSSVFDTIKSNITSPIQNAWNTISSIPQKIMNAFSGIKISIPKPKLPHFNVSWNDFGPVKLPSVSISWYAKGGIFDAPSIIGVGEAGREAVLPIDRLSDLMADALNQIGAYNQQPAQVVSVNVELNAQIRDGADAYTTGQQIGAGIASKLKQRGVQVAT